MYEPSPWTPGHDDSPPRLCSSIDFVHTISASVDLTGFEHIFLSVMFNVQFLIQLVYFISLSFLAVTEDWCEDSRHPNITCDAFPDSMDSDVCVGLNYTPGMFSGPQTSSAVVGGS